MKRLLERLPELSLLASVAAFLLLGSLYAKRLPVWHEIVSSLPSSGYRVIDTDQARRSEAAIPLEPSCTDASPPRFAVSAVRPNLGACVGGQTLPLLITSYASGIGTWPFALGYAIHGNDTFVLRAWWLIVAAIALVLMFRLVSRIADRATAAVACAITAVSTPFVMINALLVPYETLPSTFVVAGLAIWMGGRPEGTRLTTPGTVRLTLGALFVGLALATNLKTLFFITPLALLFWRSGGRWRMESRERTALSVGIILPLLPLIFFALTDPHHGFERQLEFRSRALLDNLRVERLVTEPLMLWNFAADITSYLVLITERDAIRPSWMHFAVALPITYCMVAGITHLARRPRGSRLAAACGAIITTYFFVSFLLYQQYPGGNYSPLHDVLGVAMGAACVDGARYVHALASKRRLRVPPAGALAVLFAAVLMFGSAQNLLARLGALESVPVTFNARVARDLVDHLLSVPDRSTLVMTTTYNDAGVIDAVGRGQIRVIQAQELLKHCNSDPRGVERCLRDELRWLLTRVDALPLRVTIPMKLALVDHPRDVLEELPHALEDVVDELGLHSRVERTFGVSEHEPITALLRIEAPPGWTPQATAAPRHVHEPVTLTAGEKRARPDEPPVQSELHVLHRPARD